MVWLHTIFIQINTTLLYFCCLRSQKQALFLKNREIFDKIFFFAICKFEKKRCLSPKNASFNR